MIPKSGHRFSDRIMRKRKIEHGINRSGNDERDQNRDHAVLALLAELLWSEWRIGRLYRLAGRLRHRRQSVAVSVLACVGGSPIVAGRRQEARRSGAQLAGADHHSDPRYAPQVKGRGDPGRAGEAGGFTQQGEGGRAGGRAIAARDTLQLYQIRPPWRTGIAAGSGAGEYRGL